MRGAKAQQTMRLETTDTASAEMDEIAANPQDARLIRGLRDGDTAAAVEFIRRFLPLLMRRAGELRVPAAERETVVISFLDDIAWRISVRVTPRSLHTYIVRAFQNEILMSFRRAKREHQLLEAQSSELGDVRIVRETCSDYLIRSVANGAGDPDAADGLSGDIAHLSGADVPVANALVAHLMGDLSTDGQKIFLWLARNVPTREIGESLGITHGTARVRISRLRTRMHMSAISYLGTLSGRPYEALAAYLVRAGVIGRSGADRKCDPAVSGSSAPETMEVD